jgi:hypothetical protein
MAQEGHRAHARGAAHAGKRNGRTTAPPTATASMRIRMPATRTLAYHQSHTCTARRPATA